MSHGSNQGGVIPLSALRLNQLACIARIGGDESVRHRVEEMGLRPGALVRMLRTASPQIIAIHGRRLSLRTNADLEVWVETSEANTSAGDSA